MTLGALPIHRGCGQRKRGGIYAECGLSPVGRPLEDFLVDPPLVIEPKAFGVSPIGVTLFADPESGVTHILDWVGEESYPCVTDFLEEVRRFGLSRRLPRTLPFERMTAQSRIILLHRKASVTDPTPYLADWRRPCPQRLPTHAVPTTPAPHCASLWWEDAPDGDVLPTIDSPADADPRMVRRSMPSFSYLTRLTPAGVQPQYQPAIFARFPLARLVVIADPEGSTHHAALDCAQQSTLPVEVEEA